MARPEYSAGRPNWKGRIQRFAHGAGIHLDRWPPRDNAASRRQRLLSWLAVDVLFDVGANSGQYATEIRNLGYEGKIVSFEPLAAPFVELQAAAQSDPLWAVRHAGLGATSGDAEINVSASTCCSSMLPMARRAREIYPRDTYVGTERIRIETLDSVSVELLERSARVGVKMDVQGYEMEVLRGGAEVLRRAVFVESEIGFVELYEGQARAEQLIDTFYRSGFRLAAFEHGRSDPRTGAIIWANAIFIRDA